MVSPSSSNTSNLFKLSTNQNSNDQYKEDSKSSLFSSKSLLDGSSFGNNYSTEFGDKKPAHHSDSYYKSSSFNFESASKNNRPSSLHGSLIGETSSEPISHRSSSIPSASYLSNGDNVSTSSFLTLLSKNSSSSPSMLQPKTPLSSFSSTGPILQLVDENQVFNHQLESHLCDSLHLYPRGGTSSSDYKVIAVFGAQSSGKSTLLNALFGTGFPVMRDDIRAQTTKGIWLSKAQGAPFLILDVEGTDGRERGENQDFERKAALFSLAIAQVVIINMWEYSVGLYTGANMALLKTVLEVHSQLFQNQKSASRTTLLFVVRDYIGTTPFSQLQSVIKNDLTAIWSSLSRKTTSHERNDYFEDHFTVSFASLPHKILKSDEFSQQVKDLSARFYEMDSPLPYTPTSGPIFSQSKRSDFIHVPLDGFATYASSIWERVRTNKDLDLPTQQQLLAQFRCAELSQIALDRLETSLSSLILPNGGLHPSLGASLDALLTTADAEFLGTAQRYHPGTVEKQRLELLERAINSVRPIVSEQLRNIGRRALLLFVGGIEVGTRTGSQKFAEVVSFNLSSAISFFDEKVKGMHTFVEILLASTPQIFNESSDSLLSIPRNCGFIPIDWGVIECRKELVESIVERASFYKREELQKALSNVSDSFQKALSRRLAGLLDDAASGLLESRKKSSSDLNKAHAGSIVETKSSTGLWEALFQLYPRLVADAQTALSNRVSSILISDQQGENTQKENSTEGKELSLKLYRSCWDNLLTRLKDDFSTTSIVMARLKRRFEKSFRYDLNSTPKLWTPGEDVNKPYNIAIEQTNLLLDDFSELVSIPIGAVFIPSTQITDCIRLITPEQKALYRESFLKDAELAFMEATRSTMLQPRTHIPTWLLVLLVVLGWNELMAVMGSPIYFLFALLVVGGLFLGGYLPALGTFIPAIHGISNLLVSKILEYLQQFSHGYSKNDYNGFHDDRRKPKNNILSTSLSRNDTESHFDTQRIVFGGNKYASYSSSNLTELESDDNQSTLDERSPLLPSTST